MPRALDRALRVIAAALAVSLAIAAWHDVSKAWDTWAYHLPFAARIVGIVGPDEYVFSADNARRFEGFPLFAELLQGVLWKVTTRPESAAFVALFSLFGLVAFLWRVFRMAPHVAFMAFLAIPLVQIHATQCYVDLPANVGLTLLLLFVHKAWTDETKPSVRLLVGAAACAIATANTKFQLVPLVLVASAALLVRVIRARERGLDRKALAVFAIALPLVFATPLKNMIVHGNPVWPVQLGLGMPYAETRYESAPHWLENTPRPARFALSVLEISVDRWSVDQWTPPEHPGKRMGGFFGAYVVAGLAGIALALWKKRTRETRVAAAVFGVTSLVVSVLPQSHELRYYLAWMLLLVSFNLILWLRDRPRVTTALMLAAFAWVTWTTKAAYLYASGDSFHELVQSRVDKKLIAHAKEGDHVCVSDDPWTFLYAGRFHGKKITVREVRHPSDCPTRPSPPSGSPAPEPSP